MIAICFRRVGFPQEGAAAVLVSNVVVSMVRVSWSDGVFDSRNFV